MSLSATKGDELVVNGLIGTYPNKAIHPKSRDFSANQIVELNDWHSGWENHYKYIVERPNTMGRKIKIKPIMSQTLTVYSGDYPTQAGVVFKAEKQGIEDAHLWQVFADNGRLNQNKQISTIVPANRKKTDNLLETCVM